MAEFPTFSDYAGAEAWLLSITDFERLLGSPAVRYDTQNFDLERFRAQLAALGDPHLRYGVVHVAGTKGKGSTCAFLESAFRACGLKTGLYTSPHLERFTERIRVNGCEIAESDFARLIGEMGRRMAQPEIAHRKIISNSNSEKSLTREKSSTPDEVPTLEESPIPKGSQSEPPNSVERPVGFRTVFEILTAAAFHYFAEQQIDVAIIETGLGGRLDSTNMFDSRSQPLVNVITAVGLDHVSILGDSIAAIAGEKAGIVRPHSRVVVAPQVDDVTAATVRDVVTARCAAVGAAEPIFAEDVIAINADGLDCWRFQARGGWGNWNDGRGGGPNGGVEQLALTAALERGIRICPGLHGEHQAKNVSAALAALVAYEAQARQLGAISFSLPADGVCAGIENTIWPGRFQEVESAGVTFVVDGAHCAISAAALGLACRQHFGQRTAVAVVGFLRDKAGEEILDGVFGQIPVTHAVGVVPPTPRAISGDVIEAALVERLGREQVEMATDVESAMARAREIAQKANGYVVVYGSLYLVGPALRSINGKT